MADYVASRGTTALSILGTVLGSLGVVGNGGLGLFNNNAMCHENMPVNRFELEQEQKIAKLETEVKLRDANFYSISEIGKLRDYVDAKFAAVNNELCEQRVYNATNIANINCISGQVAQLMALTKTVIPNSSICPGWGEVTVTPAAATTA